MARLNVYVPDELAARAREAGLNVSRLTQDAIADALGAADTNAWLASLGQPEGAKRIDNARVLELLDEGREEFGDFGER